MAAKSENAVISLGAPIPKIIPEHGECAIRWKLWNRMAAIGRIGKRRSAGD
jgi:hypothetical protein